MKRVENVVSMSFVRCSVLFHSKSAIHKVESMIMAQSMINTLNYLISR